jgi:hypothetical protein
VQELLPDEQELLLGVQERLPDGQERLLDEKH